MTVSSRIDELEDAHREPMSAAEKQAWAEVDRLTALAKKLEVERDEAMARIAVVECDRHAARDECAALVAWAHAWESIQSDMKVERDMARTRVALLERELAHIRDQVAASMRAAGVTL